MSRPCLDIPPYPKSMLREHKERPDTCKDKLSTILNTLERKKQGNLCLELLRLRICVKISLKAKKEKALTLRYKSTS
jgi:hypothetical protein